MPLPIHKKYDPALKQLFETFASEIIIPEQQCYREMERTWLHIASERGYMHMIEKFDSTSIDINARCLLGKTPLHLAAQEGHINVVQFLLNNGADINAQDELSSTPLYMAAEYGRLPVVKFLLEKGAKTDHISNHHPLQIASANGHLEIVQHLIEGLHTFAINSTTPSALRSAQDHEQWEVATYLESQGAKLDKQVASYSDPKESKIINILATTIAIAILAVVACLYFSICIYIYKLAKYHSVESEQEDIDQEDNKEDIDLEDNLEDIDLEAAS